MTLTLMYFLGKIFVLFGSRRQNVTFLKVVFVSQGLRQRGDAAWLCAPEVPVVAAMWEV